MNFPRCGLPSEGLNSENLWSDAGWIMIGGLPKPKNLAVVVDSCDVAVVAAQRWNQQSHPVVPYE